MVVLGSDAEYLVGPVRMRPFHDIDTGLGLNLLDNSVLVRTVVEQARPYVHSINAFPHGRHPGLQVDQPKCRRCAGTSTAM